MIIRYLDPSGKPKTLNPLNRDFGLLGFEWSFKGPFKRTHFLKKR